ncbi:pyruvate formate-lyase-activating protein [Lentisphaerota bacterium WC36G]|nr:pyruvate formate lyase-activating protein [Lentisphaerae bacterium WC36]
MTSQSEIKGRIHSFESCGTVDGPGLRFIVFMQGCPLRCLYCHNPDSWATDQGKLYSVEEIFEQIQKYKSFMRFSNGGVTVSGGEPLLQAQFVNELFKLCHEQGINTALDTSGIVSAEYDIIQELYSNTDLVLLDMKASNAELYKKVTKGSFKNVSETLNYLTEINKDVWIRHVLVPKLTDYDEYLHELGKLLANRSNIKLVEILPFHQIGEFKWHELELTYELKGVPEPTAERVENAVKILEGYGLKVRA